MSQKIKKNRGKKMSWFSDTPEDQVICLFAGFLANPDMPLSLNVGYTETIGG
jgi:hypothetical protein